ATTITFSAKAEYLIHLDLAYAPSFSTTKDSVIYTGIIGHNITRGRKIITPEEVVKQKNDLLILDVRSPKQFEVDHVDGAINVPLKTLRSYAKTLDENQTIVTYCNKGT